MPALDVIWTLEPISLAETDRCAALTERRDRKYLLCGVALDELIAVVDANTRVLEIDGRRSFRYESVYFDTPELDSYHMSARSRPARVKVRTRSYLDSADCALEIKSRSPSGSTIKHRFPHPIEQRRHLTRADRMLVARSTPVAFVDQGLQPTLTVTYVRSTLVEPETQSRITIDTDVEGVDSEGRRITLDGWVIVETKTEAPPSEFDRLLWRHHHRPSPISKYCTLMAALDPSLPANKWNRTLRNHFDWSSARG